MRGTADFVEPPDGGAFAHDPMWLRRRDWTPTTQDELERGIRLFLRDTDVAVSGDRGSLTLDGKPADLSGILDRPFYADAGSLDIVIDRNAPHALDASVRRQLEGRVPPERIKARKHGGGLVETQAGARAVIHATHAKIVRADGRSLRLDAHFLRDGGQWTKLAGVLGLPPAKARHAPMTEMPAQPSPRVLTEFPTDVDAQTRALVERASQQLRDARRLAYGHRIIVSDDERRLELDVIVDRNPLEAPLRYAAPAGVVRGALRLRTPAAPLALRLDEPAPAEVVTAAWTAALIALEQLLCADAPDAETDHADIPRTLAPTRETARLLDSYVVGHPRRLSPPRTPDPEKCKVASGLGIKLAENETWVRPHLRGAPENSVLEFIWVRSTDA